MSKRVRKDNYLYYDPYLYWDGGEFLRGLKDGMGNLDSNSLGSSLGGAMGAIGSTAGGVVGGLLSNGLESKAGSVLNTIGDIGSVIPGPIGSIIGGGTKIVGGLVNAAFGTKANQEKLNAANQGTNYLNNFTSNASSFDEIQNPQAQAAVENAYKGGWFSKGKARRKNAELREQRRLAQDFANRSVDNNVDNIAGEQMDNMLTNYAAFGGPLDFGLFPVEGAIDYELAQRRLAQKDSELKKALGGPLHTHGADWTNGITVIDNGGTHEQNPFEGVPMGVAPDGQPNLVEEGEVIFNDYVFSNRIKVPKAVREKYKLKGQKEMTFADAAKKAQKESEERPNDPISKRGLEDIMNKLMLEQETLREKRQSRKYAEGGGIRIKPSKRGTFTAAASKHNMGVQEFASKVLANPEDYSPAMRKKANFARNASKWKHAYGGIIGHFFDGTNPEGQFLQFYTPEEKIVRDWQNKGLLPTLTLPKPAQLPYSLQTPQQRQATLDFKLDAPSLLDTRTLAERWVDDNIKPVPFSTRAASTTSTTSTTANTKGANTRNSWLTGLRFVPAIGAGLGVFSDLMGWTNKPDYSNAQSILDAASSIGDVRYSPIGDYMKYTPLDRMFYANQLGAQAGATRRNILNTSGGNRGTAMAGLLAADYNAQGQLGNLFRQAEEYNLGQRERVANFNRATNMFNAENELKAQMANKENARIRVDAAARAAAIRDQVDARIGAARSANLTNLFNSLGDIGREAFTMNMVMSNPALYYSIDKKDGTITYKNGFDELSEGEKAQVRRAAERASKKKARGGYLTIKRRR